MPVSTVEEDWREAVANQDAGNETSTSSSDTGKFHAMRKILMGTAGLQSFVQEAQNANTNRATMHYASTEVFLCGGCTAEQLERAR